MKTKYTLDDLHSEMARIMRAALNTNDDALIEEASMALRRAAMHDPGEIVAHGGDPDIHGGLPGLAELANVGHKLEGI